MSTKLKKAKRKIAVVTGIRSEYSLLYPLMKAIEEHPALELKLFVTGAHLSETYGLTINEIIKDGFNIEERIESLVDSNTGAGRLKGAAIQLIALTQAFERVKPDILIAPFDREEAITMALVGTYLNIPVVHVGAGDRVEGNVDDYIRHAVTKLAHLHFAATNNNRKRIIQMGEEPWRVKWVGNIGLDKYRTIKKIDRKELTKKLGFSFTAKEPLLVLLFHPLSTESESAGQQMTVIMKVLKELAFKTVVIFPNSDAGSQEIIEVINSYSGDDYLKIFKNLEKEVFVNLLRNCDLLIGNSSCGILEAPLLKLPVINIGMRQRGREHAANVQFVGFNPEQIKKAVRRSLFDKRYKDKVAKCLNPYGYGHTSQKVVRVLESVRINKHLLQKQITY